MHLKITTDYAIRCMLYLAKKSGKATSQEISEATGISQNYVQQILRLLRIERIIASSIGECGGYTLIKTPDDISVMDIISPFENGIRINHCSEDNSSDGYRHCSVQEYYNNLQTMIENYFNQTTLQELLDRDEAS